MAAIRGAPVPARVFFHFFRICRTAVLLRPARGASHHRARRRWLIAAFLVAIWLPVHSACAQQLRQLRFEGNAVLSESELQAAVAPFLGAPLSLQRLNDATAAVQALYQGRGYLFATAVIPQQDVVDGSVRIAVFEGRLGSVRVRGTAGSDAPPAASAWLAARLPPGVVLGKAALDDTAGLAAAMFGWQVRFNAVTGADVGSVDLETEVVATRDARSKGEVSVDNYGSRQLGVGRMQLRLDRNDLFAAGDRLTVFALQSERRESLFGGVSYGGYLNSGGLRAFGSVTRSIGTVGDQFAALQAVAIGDTVEAGLTQPIVRSDTGMAEAGATLEDKRFASSMLGNAVQGNHLRVMRARLAGALWAPGAGMEAAAVTSVGQNRITLPAAAAADQADGGFHAQGRFARLQVDWRGNLVPASGWLLDTRLAGQWASGNLDGSEKFGLGGPGRVRAASVTAALGDAGVFASAELSRDLSASLPAAQRLSVSTFYDAGRVQRNRMPGNVPASERELANRVSRHGAGLGLKLAANGWSANLEYAVPFGAARSEGPQTWLSLSLGF